MINIEKLVKSLKLKGINKVECHLLRNYKLKLKYNAIKYGSNFYDDYRRFLNQHISYYHIKFKTEIEKFFELNWRTYLGDNQNSKYEINPYKRDYNKYNLLLKSSYHIFFLSKREEDIDFKKIHDSVEQIKFKIFNYNGDIEYDAVKSLYGKNKSVNIGIFKILDRSKETQSKLLDKITVNYIRHNLTYYDTYVRGHTSFNYEARKFKFHRYFHELVKYKFNILIGETFPKYKVEVDNQNNKLKYIDLIRSKENFR